VRSRKRTAASWRITPHHTNRGGDRATFTVLVDLVQRSGFARGDRRPADGSPFGLAAGSGWRSLGLWAGTGRAVAAAVEAMGRQPGAAAIDRVDHRSGADRVARDLRPRRGDDLLFVQPIK
jgi:hypothetical protein